MRKALIMLLLTLTAHGQPFEDVTEQVGMTVPSLAGAWGDYDNDGWMDVYVAGTLMHNDQGKKFTKVAGHGLSGQGGLWADYDNDGKLDLYTWYDSNLFRSLGNGKWENQTAKLPDRPMKSSRGACWGDFDGDGFVDLYLGGWEEPHYQPDCIYRNNGDGSFALHWTGTGRNRPARGVTAADIDLDGDLDIYVSNYRLDQNLLWLNDGKGKFTEVAVDRNVGGVYGASQAWGHAIGSSFGDLDNDGLFDLFIGNFSHPASYQDRPQFMRNMGKEHGFKFEDMSKKAGLKWQESFGSPTLGDYDNDGDLDLYYTTVYGGDHCVIYRNNGDWSFTDVTSELGINASTTYQATWIDYDNDGDLDLLTNARLYRNPGTKNHWLKLRLTGAGKVNSAAIATNARIELNGKTLLRQVGGGTGEGNQNDPTLHFGLGEHTGEVTLQIHWTDGKVQTIRSAVDKTVTVKHSP